MVHEIYIYMHACEKRLGLLALINRLDDDEGMIHVEFGLEWT